MSTTRKVDTAIARFDEVMHRLDRGAASRTADERSSARGRAAMINKLTAIGIVLAVILAGTIAAGLILNGIGLIGFVGAVVLAMVAVAVLALWEPGEKPLADYKDDMPNKAVVQRLDNLLLRKRALLPAPAAHRLDAISGQLPLLESQLADADILDPLAQDARRLMGRHLPELIERYERVPEAYRGERDGEGLTVDERLVQGLDAAKTALDELGRKLVRDDMDAFQTQGRFIESRYKDEDGPIKGA